MVEFITLFLGGLVVGQRSVELAVTDPVARVEFFLDNRSAGVLQEAPWVAEIDFGGLAPHLLEAVGFAASGEEIHRARQWVNFNAERAEARLVIDQSPEQGGLVARVSWRVLGTAQQPKAVRALLDGRSLEADDPAAIRLPPTESPTPRYLEVRLEFADAPDVTLGGLVGGNETDEIEVELTPFPVLVREGVELPSQEAMGRMLMAGGSAGVVRAVEKGPALIVVVRSWESRQFLNSMELRPDRGADVLLRKGHELRLLEPRRILSSVDERLFPISQPFSRRDGSLSTLLRTGSLVDGRLGGQTLANAVAVAGLAATASGKRRAVVLLTTVLPSDDSDLNWDQVRRYLRMLGVPFRVWIAAPTAGESGDWGVQTEVFSRLSLSRAYRELSRELEGQRIVWLEGAYLPQQIALGADTGEIESVE